MNKIIEKINFKKVVIIYLVLLMITGVILLFFLGNKYQNKLSLVHNYHQIDEMLEENANQKELENVLRELDKSSRDVVDVAIIRKGNLVFQTGDIYQNDLTKIKDTKRYFTDNKNNVYELKTSEEFLLNLFIPNRYFEEERNYIDRLIIEDISYKEKYTINYMENENGNELIIFISQINQVENGHFYLKLTLSILMFFFMLYIIITALMIYQDALRKQFNYYFWGLLTLFTNIVGVVIYLFYKKKVINQKSPTFNKENRVINIERK